MSLLTKPISKFGSYDMQATGLSFFIYLSTQNLVFLVYQEKKVIAIEVYPYSLELLESCFKNLQAVQDKLEIVLDNLTFALLPANEVLVNDMQEYGAQVFGQIKGKVHSDAINLQYKYLFLENDEWEKLRKAHLPKARISHYAKHVFLHCLNETNEKTNVNIVLRQGFFYIAIWQKQSLKLFNSYAFQNKNEFGFFSLGAMKNLNINLHEAEVIIEGFVDNESPLQRMLDSYVNHVQRKEIELPNPIFYPYAALLKTQNP